MLKQLWVGEWWVDETVLKIQRGEEIQKLEPLVMSLLLRLAEVPGEVVSKESLVQDLWAMEHVTDQAITVALYNLRKALGDSAKEPTYIQTVPRKGYRLIAVVRYPQLTRDEAAQPEAEAKVMPIPKRHPIVYGLLVAFVLLLGFMGWTRMSATAEAHQPLKAAFVPLQGNDQTAWMADALNYALRENLRRQYRLIGWESLQDPDLADLDPQTLRARLGTDLLVSGRLQPVDGGVMVELKALSNKGTKLIRLTLDGAASFNQLSGLVRKLLGASDQQPMESPTLSDPLLKKFLALYNQHGTSPETYLEKIDAFKQILDQYPDFAAGHFGLANAYLWACEYGFYDRDEAFYQCRKHTEEGLRLNPRSPDGLILKASLAMHFDWDFVAADRLFGEARQQGACGPDAYLNHIYLLAVQAKFSAAWDLLAKAEEAEPFLKDWEMVAFNLTMFEGNPERGLALLKTVRSQMNEETILLREYAFYFALEQEQELNRIEDRLLEIYGVKDADLAAYRQLQTPIQRRSAFGTYLSEKMEVWQKTQYVSPVQFAIVHAYAGHADRVFPLLEEALRRRDAQCLFVNVMPAFRPYHENPRFQEFVRAVGVSQTPEPQN